MSTPRAVGVFPWLTALAGFALHGCIQPECANPDYTTAECRVIAENELARILTSRDLETRFQAPDVEDAATWDARGLLEEIEPGVLAARVATLGRFAITLEPGPTTAGSLELVLTNVDPRATVEVGTEGNLVEVAPPEHAATTRRLGISLPQGETTWVRGRIQCPERFRLAALGDVQTNPTQLDRIVDSLQIEYVAADEAGEPLLGALLLGDVTELSRQSEFDVVSEAIERAPVPIAVTPGNHDVFSRDRPLYNRTFGPGNYAFDVCGARIALLDTGNGSLARSIEARLPELLHRGDADVLVAAMHYPPYAGFTGAGWGREDQAQHLMIELARQDADLIVAGHVHALLDFPDIPVGDHRLREIVVGTAGANQGLGVPRYGYVRLVVGDGRIDPCFVEVPPPGASGDLKDPISDALPYCDE